MKFNMNKIIILLLLLISISFSQVKTTENLQWELGSIEVSYKVIDSVKYSTSQTKVLDNLPRVAISYKVTELKPHAKLYGSPTIILQDRDGFELVSTADFNNSNNSIIMLSHKAEITTMIGRNPFVCEEHYHFINGECKYYHKVSLPIGAIFINDSSDTWVCQAGFKVNHRNWEDSNCEYISQQVQNISQPVQKYESMKDYHYQKKENFIEQNSNSRKQKDNSKGRIIFLILSIMVSAFLTPLVVK